jgi:hypothetical protein
MHTRGGVRARRHAADYHFRNGNGSRHSEHLLYHWRGGRRNYCCKLSRGAWPELLIWRTHISSWCDASIAIEPDYRVERTRGGKTPRRSQTDLMGAAECARSRRREPHRPAQSGKPSCRISPRFERERIADRDLGRHLCCLGVTGASAPRDGSALAQGCSALRGRGFSPRKRRTRGALEHAQEMAARESPRTTKLYDRTKERLTQNEVERIRF